MGASLPQSIHQRGEEMIVTPVVRADRHTVNPLLDCCLDDLPDLFIVSHVDHFHGISALPEGSVDGENGGVVTIVCRYCREDPGRPVNGVVKIIQCDCHLNQPAYSCLAYNSFVVRIFTETGNADDADAADVRGYKVVLVV